MSSPIHSDSLDWKLAILNMLHQRNKSENKSYFDLISLHNRLFEYLNSLKGENLQLTIQNEKLKSEMGNVSNYSGPSQSKPNDKIQQMEQKLLHQQEELTELHRRKGENAQQLIDLNQKLNEQLKIKANLELSLSESYSQTSKLHLDNHQLLTANQELDNLNQMLKDEHQALQLAFAALEEKLRKTQDENRSLLERLMKYKSKDADKLNEENENFLRKKQAKIQKELEEAAKETRDALKETNTYFAAAVPTKVVIKFDAHDGEVNAVKWSPVDRDVITGGADRKVKLWDVSKVAQTENKGTLVGSNAGVMSVDFDSTGSFILGASSDFATRVWTIQDQRLRHTLTGHSGKVMAAKFLGEPTKVVTGSHDRTLKIWDLRSKACITTKFAGSSCNDLVTSDGSGTTIISGHFDKKIRFWDARSEESVANQFPLQGKVTSLDLSRDANYLLSCVRDDTLKMFDLRMNQVVRTFSAEGFKVGCDWTRACFRPDRQYIAAGSADGCVYVWNVHTEQVEVLPKEHASAVTAVAWHPCGTYLISVDKTKKAIIWEEA